MGDPPPRRFRSPLGIFEAAALLVLAGGVLWLLRPLPAARRAAASEKEVQAVLGAVADAEDARTAGRKGGFLPLDALTASDPTLRKALGGFGPSGAAGVLGNGSYWLAVLLPGTEGTMGPAIAPDPAFADRGYAVIAWPRRGAARALRALAALPNGILWQRSDGMRESGVASRPPVPRTTFPPPGKEGPIVPDPPPDWVAARKRTAGK